MLVRRLLGLLVGSILIAAPATLCAVPAKAEPPVDASLLVTAVDELSQNPPIYSDPRAPLALSSPQVLQVQDAIAAAQTPIYVALLPGRAGKPLQVSGQLREAIKQPGAYVAITGESYAATSDLFEVADLLQEAFIAKRTHGTAEVLVRFAQLAGERAHGREASRPATPWLGAGIILAAIVLAALAYGLHNRWRRRLGAADSGRTVSSPRDEPPTTVK